jgi:hypothetical protein
VIQSLAFATLKSFSDSCLSKGYDPAALLNVHETVHQRLARQGVRSIQLAHRSYADSPYNSIASAGAELVRHTTLAEALVQLKQAPEIASFWHVFDEVMRNIDSPDTLYLITADHGHVYADVQQTLYINERWPELREALAVAPTGNPIWPNGSARDVFLHVKAERREWALDLLRTGLADIAHVMAVDAALAEGLFGPHPVCEELRRRLGDILILPRLGHFVWWREPGIMANRYYGHHGGLSPEEAITVLGAINAL